MDTENFMSVPDLSTSKNTDAAAAAAAPASAASATPSVPAPAVSAAAQVAGSSNWLSTAARITGNVLGGTVGLLNSIPVVNWVSKPVSSGLDSFGETKTAVSPGLSMSDSGDLFTEDEAKAVFSLANRTVAPRTRLTMRAFPEKISVSSQEDAAKLARDFDATHTRLARESAGGNFGPNFTVDLSEANKARGAFNEAVAEFSAADDAGRALMAPRMSSLADDVVTAYMRVSNASPVPDPQAAALESNLRAISDMANGINTFPNGDPDSPQMNAHRQQAASFKTFVSGAKSELDRIDKIEDPGEKQRALQAFSEDVAFNRARMEKLVEQTNTFKFQTFRSGYKRYRQTGEEVGVDWEFVSGVVGLVSPIVLAGLSYYQSEKTAKRQHAWDIEDREDAQAFYASENALSRASSEAIAATESSSGSGSVGASSTHSLGGSIRSA